MTTPSHFVTNNNGTSLVQVNADNTLTDLGGFVDQEGNTLYSVYGLAFGKDGSLYATQQNGGSNKDKDDDTYHDTQIWKVNPTPVNGKIELTKIGTGAGLHNGSAIDTHAMDIAPDGAMYMWDLKGDIFTIDLATGVATYVATTNKNGTEDPLKFTMDIAYGPDGAAYACAEKVLYKIETDGTSTTIGSLTADIMGLSFDPDGTLYGSSYTSPSGKLYTINTSTAALTEVTASFGTYPHGGDLYIAYTGWPTTPGTPVISNAGETLTFSEVDGATVIDSSISISDADDTNIESATVTISFGFESAEDVLSFSDTSTITGTWDASTGVLTLTGPDTLANYEAALESVTYNNISDNPNTANRTISWVVNDGDENSSAATSTIIFDVIAAPTPSPSPQPTPTPAPEPTPDPTPADTAPLATDVQLSDDDGDGLKEVITAADGALIDGNGDGIADAEQSDVVGLRMINDGADNTDYGALETDPDLSFSAVSFLSPTELAANNSETYAVTTSDGQTQTTAIPTGIDNAFAGLLGFTVSGLSNGGSTSTTISLPQGLNTLDTAQLAYLRFNYATNRFEDFVDASGTPLYAFQDSNGDGQLDSVVLQLIDGDPAWDGDGIANGSIIDPGFLATGDRKLSGNNKDNTLQGNVLANTLLGKGGSDTLIGDLGNDTLIGNGKHDRLRGGEGDDTLKGKTGNDRLNGGDHDDHLDGGKGDDTLIGGSGADRFRLSKGSDTIKDFSIADDDQLLISNAIELTIEQIGSNLLLTDADKDISTTLKGVALDDLLAHQPELFG